MRRRRKSKSDDYIEYAKLILIFIIVLIGWEIGRKYIHIGVN